MRDSTRRSSFQARREIRDSNARQTASRFRLKVIGAMQGSPIFIIEKYKRGYEEQVLARANSTLLSARSPPSNEHAPRRPRAPFIGMKTS